MKDVACSRVEPGLATPRLRLCVDRPVLRLQVLHASVVVELGALELAADGQKVVGRVQEPGDDHRGLEAADLLLGGALDLRALDQLGVCLEQ